MSHPESIDQLLEDLHSPQSFRRQAAAFELGRRTPVEPRVLEALQAAAATDADAAVQGAATSAYRDLSGDGMAPSAGAPQVTATIAAVQPARRKDFWVATILSLVVNVVADVGLSYGLGNFLVGGVALLALNGIVFFILRRNWPTVANGVVLGVVLGVLLVPALYIGVLFVAILLGCIQHAAGCM